MRTWQWPRNALYVVKRVVTSGHDVEAPVDRPIRRVTRVRNSVPIAVHSSVAALQDAGRRVG